MVDMADGQAPQIAGQFSRDQVVQILFRSRNAAEDLAREMLEFINGSGLHDDMLLPLKNAMFAWMLRENPLFDRVLAKEMLARRDAQEEQEA